MERVAKIAEHAAGVEERVMSLAPRAVALENYAKAIEEEVNYGAPCSSSSSSSSVMFASLTPKHVPHISRGGHPGGGDAVPPGDHGIAGGLARGAHARERVR
jgi:hypothetical protein